MEIAEAAELKAFDKQMLGDGREFEVNAWNATQRLELLERVRKAVPPLPASVRIGMPSGVLTTNSRAGLWGIVGKVMVRLFFFDMKALLNERKAGSRAAFAFWVHKAHENNH